MLFRSILTVTGPDSSIWGNEATAYVPQIVPVELISFNANVINNEVQLSWQTATETNNQGFAIERKHNFGDWQRIGFVEGTGTTTETQSYSFVDDDVEAGKYQYRLKQIDYNGTYEYSKIIEVEIAAPTKFSLEQNYPNPFNPTTTITFQLPLDKRISLKVYDILGKEVKTLINDQEFKKGNNKVVWDGTDNFGSKVASGNYIYTLKYGNFTKSMKMTLLK